MPPHGCFTVEITKTTGDHLLISVVFVITIFALFQEATQIAKVS